MTFSIKAAFLLHMLHLQLTLPTVHMDCNGRLYGNTEDGPSGSIEDGQHMSDGLDAVELQSS